VKESQGEASYKLGTYERDKAPAKLEYWDRADAALGELATGFTPSSPWARANAGNPKALKRAAQAAERAKKKLEESRKARAAYRMRSQ
jgi:hypothetical protein